MEENTSFRITLAVCCILLAIGYICIQLQLPSQDVIQVQVQPFQPPLVSETKEWEEQ